MTSSPGLSSRMPTVQIGAFSLVTLNCIERATGTLKCWWPFSRLVDIDLNTFHNLLTAYVKSNAYWRQEERARFCRRSYDQALFRSPICFQSAS